MIAAHSHRYPRRAETFGRERLDDLTHALEDAVVTVAEDRHAHRYMGHLAQMLGRVHELHDDASSPRPTQPSDNEHAALRLSVEELTHRTLWLQQNAAERHDAELARTFADLRQRLATLH